MQHHLADRRFEIEQKRLNTSYIFGSVIVPETTAHSLMILMYRTHQTY